ncbi:MAG TPA: prepilin-type N-terminal cleavage/methylation domain-containing protein [Planctomycetota bacterium]|jgi:prepilin-type N-terminal cleavage/methylation domain-containing protein|nr:prepilin-type N-terminal cleavage/methylation domain-containing protein [Planctomycetota bacterium]
MRRREGFTLIELMIVIAIIAIIAAIAIPGLLQSQRAANERNASASLKTLATAEIDFRSNDRDGNRINDFWTYDVAGLFVLETSGDDGATFSPMIKMIDPSIAGADAMNEADVTADPGALAPWVYRRQTANIPTRGPKSGYWYYALVSDASEGSLEAYKGSTDGTTANVHHPSKFGFGCFPDSFGSGRSLFMINESATVIKFPLNRTVRPNPASFPPGARPINTGSGHPSSWDNWPSDTDIKLASKLD